MTAPPGSLEQRLADLEGGLRSLMAGNWTDRASVVDAQGQAVRLSALAFGQGVSDPTPDVVLTAPAGPVGQTGSVGWQSGDPIVYALVTGGRLRVDWAAHVTALGVNTYMNMCYTLSITGSPEEGKDAYPPVIVETSDVTRSVLAGDFSGQERSTIASGSNFTLHTGLVPGWYRVRAQYLLNYTRGASTPTGTVKNPRIAVTPL